MSFSMISKLSVAVLALASSATALKGDHFYKTNENGDTNLEAMGYRYEGVAGYLWHTDVAHDKDTVEAYSLKPVRRYVNHVEHFYTTNPAVEHLGGYKDEGVVFWIADKPGMFCDKHGKVPSVPLHRCYSGSIGDHLYTQHGNCENHPAYKYEGVLGYVCKNPGPKQTKDCPLQFANKPLHRYYIA